MDRSDLPCKRGCLELGKENLLDSSKKQKMRDLDTLLKNQGTSLTCNPEFSKKKEGYPILQPCIKGQTFHSRMDNCLLTLGQAGNATSSDKLQLHNKENMPNGPDPHGMDIKSKRGLNLDLNANTDEYNPFYPYKKLGLFKPTDPSECGSTTGPIEEENAPLKLWNQMKENGFLSSTQREIIAPKPRGRKPKRKIEEETRKKIVHMQTEQANRFAKVAAPSGLLSGLNPGIINHVRNSKQVYTIIEAIVRSEKVESSQVNKETAPLCDTTGRFGETDISGCNTCGELNKGYEDTGLKLGLSSDWDVELGQSSSQVTGVTDDYGSNQEVVTSLSLKATSAASQWMELLQQDIKGRLAALRRSKKRVRNVISTELPYIMSTDLSCNQNDDPSGAHSSVCPGDHVEKWKFLFMQMDKALQEEGRFLENWLIQVQQMQSMCEKGMKYVASEGITLGTTNEFSKLKKMETMEHEQIVKAAAASMYSTCNFVMNKEKVSSFS
ncbi:cation-transporting ATPase [Rhynchospora pubera]|uniref:Cation-transporting ATPase n=1 Tax=Rhynchospora pubera TaxID=906938 RepID=A0AAV8AQB9_9POAL|nr:cation-transporting ATPase [Rhynchospora pubera]KAJ4779173.1 cation-transporting ATPase [Rhynchospora pubera]